MATMSFSIPDDVRDRFNAVFDRHNKNAVITTLMLNAIDEEERRRRPPGLVERLRLVSARTPPGANGNDGRVFRDAAE